MYYELENPCVEPTMQCRAPHYTTRVKSAVSMGNVNAIIGCRTQTVMNQRKAQATRTPHSTSAAPSLMLYVHVHTLLILRPHLLLSSSIYFHNTAC